VLLALGGGALRGFGSVTRVRVLGAWKVAVHKAQLIAQPLLNSFDLGECHAAERALEVAVLDQSGGGLAWPESVIPIADRRGQAPGAW
jgi:hypothetical protein